MHPADIIAAIRKRGSNIVKVADACGVKHPNVSSVIHGKSTSRNIATYISGFTGIPLNELWPGVYDKEYPHGMRAAS